MVSTSTVLRTFALAIALSCGLVPTASAARTGGATIGGPAVPESVVKPQVAGSKAKLLKDGRAAAPVTAPEAVKNAIWAANKLIGKPYRYGGGHAKIEDSAYDCSGTISYALIGAKLLKSPLDSSSFMSWEENGVGDWITVYTNPGHAFVVIAGLRLDTSASGDPSGNKGPRWRPNLRTTKGFKARHPEGL